MDYRLLRTTSATCSHLASVLVFTFGTMLSACSENNSSSPLTIEDTDVSPTAPVNIDNSTEANQNTQVTDETDTPIELVMSSVPDNMQGTDTAPEPDTGAANALIEYAAQVYIDEHQSATGLDVIAAASFFSIAMPLIEPPVIRETIFADQCVIGSDPSNISVDAFRLPIEQIVTPLGLDVFQLRPISAGETVALQSSGGTYLTLIRMDDTNNLAQYQPVAGAPLSSAVPPDLSLSVSGDEFPFLVAPLNEVGSLEDQIISDVRLIGESGRIQWASEAVAPDTSSNVYLWAADLDELTGQLRSYSCNLIDDGEFELTPELAQLYSDGFSANFVQAARVVRTTAVENGVLVINTRVQRF